MHYYTLIVAYDGYDYHGWQWQPHKITIARELEKAFIKAFKKKPLSLVGVSRTDAGVHAWGQVMRVKTDFFIEADSLMRAWQGALPHTILLRHARYVSEDFDLHAEVIAKTYDYYISTKRTAPFISRYCVPYYGTFDKDILQKNMGVFLGEHDFRSFCTGDDKENTIRRITDISITYLKRYDIYRIRIKGPGFLRYMIRRIVGGALQVMTMQLQGDIKDGQHFLRNILLEKNPAQHLKTAPAHGLVLRSINYRN